MRSKSIDAKKHNAVVVDAKCAPATADTMFSMKGMRPVQIGRKKLTNFEQYWQALNTNWEGMQLRKALFAVALLLLALVTSGCEPETMYSLENQTEFLPESGPSQYVMLQSMAEAMNDFDFSKYGHKKVYIEVMGGTNHTGLLAQNFVNVRLKQVGATILTRLSDEEKEKGLKEEPGDFELTFLVSACGVHAYDGLLRRNIEGHTALSLNETVPQGSTMVFSSKLHRYRYEGWVFSPYFIVALLTLMTFLATAGIRGLFRSSKGIGKKAGAAALR